MQKKFLLQVLALLLFAAFAIASSQKDYEDFNEGFREGWNATTPSDWHI
ncbi:MAG: hypothetical protein IJD53_00190 [Alistipes sp.]|nr:hypothetical protein [Alistipes sp.]